MKIIKVSMYVMVCCWLYINLGTQDLQQTVSDKVKKIEKSKDVVEIFKTALWVYRRGFHKEFSQLFKKALELDKSVNRDKPKLAEILGYEKFEVETTEEEPSDEDEEKDNGKEVKSPASKKQTEKVKKEFIYDNVIKKIEYLLKKLKSDETIYETQIIKKDIAEKKVKQEKEKIGFSFVNKLISPHFILYTDVDLMTTVKILDNIEAFFNTFYFFFYDSLDFKKYKNKKVTVYIFKNNQSYREYVAKKYDDTKDPKPIDLFFHLRKNDISLFDIKNNVVLATIQSSETLETKEGKKELSMIDFVMALPDVYKAILENFLYIYIFNENKKYAELSQCIWGGIRTYFAYLIPDKTAFTIASYVGGEPNFNIQVTKDAISDNKVPTLKRLLTTNNFNDPTRDFKFDPSVALSIYITECYSIFYYLFHRTGVEQIEKVLQQLTNSNNYTYDFFSKYIKTDKELQDFIVKDLKKEHDKFKEK